jgi:hypothetical protein
VKNGSEIVETCHWENESLLTKYGAVERKRVAKSEAERTRKLLKL